MLTQLMEGNNLVVKGSLERSRDMLYVDDAVDAIFRSILTQDSRGHIINIGTGTPVTIKNLIENLCNILGKPFKDIQITEEKGTVGDPFYNSADCSKAYNLLGFTPQYDLKSGLQKVVNLRNQDVSKSLDPYQNKSGV
jgi:nucleoside-diphosphate-sugar epimerase